MSAEYFYRGVYCVTEPVSEVKTKSLNAMLKEPRQIPSGVNPKGANCTIYRVGSTKPIMSAFASANTQYEANNRARFYAKRYLNKLMKKRKPTIRSTVKGEYHATIYKGGAYHHGYGVTIEAAVENAKYNIDTFVKVLDEIIEPDRFERAGVQVITQAEPVKRWWQFWK